MPVPKWFGNKCRKISSKRKSIIREKAFAKNFNLKKTPNSGTFSRFLSDIYGEGFRVEHKMTDNRSLSIKLDWIEKIQNEAGVSGEIPIICIEIQGNRLFLVDDTQFKLLMELNKEEEE
jgi:hypothetical protein